MTVRDRVLVLLYLCFSLHISILLLKLALARVNFYRAFFLPKDACFSVHQIIALISALFGGILVRLSTDPLNSHWRKSAAGHNSQIQKHDILQEICFRCGDPTGVINVIKLLTLSPLQINTTDITKYCTVYIIRILLLALAIEIEVKEEELSIVSIFSTT